MTIPIQPVAGLGQSGAGQLDRSGAVVNAVAEPPQTAMTMIPHQVEQALTRFGDTVQTMGAAKTPEPAKIPDIEFESATKSGQGSAGIDDEMKMMVQSYDFAISTELVSRAVSEVSGSIDALVKTQ